MRWWLLPVLIAFYLFCVLVGLVVGQAYVSCCDAVDMLGGL
jgi:hypothetical protein